MYVLFNLNYLFKISIFLIKKCYSYVRHNFWACVELQYFSLGVSCGMKSTKTFHRVKNAHLGCPCDIFRDHFANHLETRSKASGTDSISFNWSTFNAQMV